MGAGVLGRVDWAPGAGRLGAVREGATTPAGEGRPRASYAVGGWLLGSRKIEPHCCETPL